MSAEANLQKIKQLESAISQLKAIESDLDSYSFTKFEKAGSGQWAGQKQKKFEAKLDNAQSHFNQAKNQLSSAISDCKNKQISLASSIDAVKHPVISAKAWATALV